MKLPIRILIIVLLMASVLFSCKKEKPAGNAEAEEVLVSYADSTLTKTDVVMRIPVGLSATDSAEMFHTIVSAWIQSQLLENLAMKSNIDMSKINRLTQEYRTQLIVNEYLERLHRSRESKFDSDDLKDYWRKHHAKMILESPLVKGVFLKLPIDNADIINVREWMHKCRPGDIDNLERFSIEYALDYDNFTQQWADWNSIAAQLPVRIDKPSEWLKEGKCYDFEKDGIAYMLYVSKVIDKGNEMPFSFAEQVLMERFAATEARNYEQRLLDGLYKKAIDNNILKINPQYKFAGFYK